MGAYEIGKLLFDVTRDAQLLEAFHSDAEPVMERYRLTEEEKKAIRDKDLRYLYQAGVHCMLLIGSPRTLGVSREAYLSAIVDLAAPPEEGVILP